jgi:ABC-type nitrate/sulfonate/bicarbonate transport system substrate-binding protein
MTARFGRRGVGRRPLLVLGAVAVLSGRGASAQGRLPISIGYQEAPDWLLFVARDRGLFERAGLAPTFIKFVGGTAMLDSARSGAIDLASVGSVAFLIGLSRGLDWTMIGINPEGAYSQGLVARKDGGIQTPTDLKGKRVGYLRGSTAQFGLMMLMRQHGLRPEQLSLLDMTPEQQLRALAARQIDAAMIWEPWIHRMIHGANARIVETEGNLGIYTNVEGYSVQRQWLMTHRETASRFLRALVTANDIVQKDPKVAIRLWAADVGIREAWAEEIYEGVPPPLIHEWTNPRYTYSLVKGSSLQRRLGFIAAYLYNEKIIQHPIEVGNATDPSLIEEVLRGRRGR